MAADGDAGQILIFSAQTGGRCFTASQNVKLTPSQYDCDGRSGHVLSWDTVSLAGLKASDFGGATVALYGADGSPVTGWTNVPLATGATGIDISSIPVSENTATLTAVVNLSAVTNSGAAQAATVRLSWKGDAAEVCFETTAGPQTCSVDQGIDNQGNAITTAANGVGDGPGGDDSGYAMFFEPANPKLSGCQRQPSAGERWAGVDLYARCQQRAGDGT